MNEKEVKVIQTDANAKDGQNKCPKCGSTDISTNTKKGKLKIFLISKKLWYNEVRLGILRV